MHIHRAPASLLGFGLFLLEFVASDIIPQMLLQFRVVSLESEVERATGGLDCFGEASSLTVGVSQQPPETAVVCLGSDSTAFSRAVTAGTESPRNPRT